MRFTLKDYQEQAVSEMLANLQKARKRWREDKERNAFSLTAPTGAGKTVMAAAVFEALFHGDDVIGFDRDPGAVVIWFSDDPSLNQQTLARFQQASDRLNPSDLVVADHSSFHRAKFEAGKIYFLNTQKLGKGSLLTRGFEESVNGQLFALRPDDRAHTIWDVIKNTIEDPALTLYLVLDEAHRGMGKESGERSTIVQRLINGDKGVPGIPVVLGISATVERFNAAMATAQNRTRLQDVKVDTKRVQDSGLIKDTIVLDIPDEAGQFDTVLVRRAADKLKAVSAEWAAYATVQGTGESVVPLLVLQVPNTPNPNTIGGWLQAIFQAWPELPDTCVAHVLGEHKTQTFGQYDVPHIEPQRVQDQTWIRVLIAKEAISTGWDCPRAEVMVSFRPASDYTHITQMLGRMVRTPLARRIPGHDKLNAVDCLLPHFDTATVEKVVKELMTGDKTASTPGRVLVNPCAMNPNPAVSEAVWAKFASLPSQTRPQRGAKPPIRLTALAHELASDALLPAAGGKAHAAMHKVLDDFIAEREAAFVEKRISVLTVEGRTIVANLQDGSSHDETFETEADAMVVTDAFRRSARILSPDIARSYTRERARRRDEDDFDDALIEAREDVAALHLMENLQVHFDAAAEQLSNKWLDEYRTRIKQLPDDRQEAYRQIIALSREAQDVDLAKPVSWIEATAVRENGNDNIKLPVYPQHLLCDELGMYPVDWTSTWEPKVLDAESRREGFRFWYRNPNRPSQDSLGIAYHDGDEVNIVRPDFIFFAENMGEIVADVIDPHGIHLADALPKLKGLARYAESHAQQFRRFEAVAEVGGKLRVLDLTRDDVRQAVMAASSAKALYEGGVAGDYV